jgi:hypothetical protein
MSQESKKVEAEGFLLGTQGVGTTAAEGEFAAIFGRRAEAVQEKFAPRLQRRAAQVAIWLKRKDEAAQRWAQMQTLAGDYLPPVFVPSLAVIVAFLLLGGEIVLIAPVLDGLAVSDPFEQKFVAGVIVLAAATLLEVAAYLYRKPGASFGWRMFSMSLAGATLIFLGWWRAAELIHAAAQGHGALRTFLTQTEGLTSLVVTLLTIILPIGATLSMDWGTTQLRLAWAWRNARRAYKRTYARHERLTKRLAAQNEVLARQRAALEQQRAEWQHAFQQAYELGQKIGAHRLPFWQVAQKITAVSLLLVAGALGGFLLIDAWLAQFVVEGVWRGALYVFSAVGLSGLYAAREVKAWLRPTAAQLYANRPTLWRTDAPTPVPTETTQTVFNEADEVTQVAARNGNRPAAAFNGR